MIKDYARALSKLDFGRRVKAMFRFVPIEGLDEQSFFDGEWDEDETDAVALRENGKVGSGETESAKRESKKATENERADNAERAYSAGVAVEKEPMREEPADSFGKGEKADNRSAEKMFFNSKTKGFESVFDEKVWLAQESGDSAEKDVGESVVLSSTERVIMPVITRIERSAERMERVIKETTERERMRELDDNSMFKERLEGVLRAEMMRNGFGYDDI